MNKYLIIEIGTNSTKSLEAEYLNGQWHNLTDTIYPSRLGIKLGITGILDKKAMSGNVEVIKNIINNINATSDCEVHIIATESLRKADNAFEFVKQVHIDTGLDIKILTGVEEAELAYQGATFGRYDTIEPISVIDIGGGSTELIFGEKDKISACKSYPIGAVKLTEFCYHNDPWKELEIMVISELINAHITDVRADYRVHKLIGVGGTVTTLAALNTAKKLDCVSALDGMALSLVDIKKLIYLFESKTLAEKESMTNMPKGRADIILAGSMILDKIMLRLGMDEVIVSTKGVRHGYLYSLIEK